MNVCPNPNELYSYKNAGKMTMGKKNKENIYDAIYDVVRSVPAGRVTNYGAVAAAIGAASGARVVGYAMNASFGITPGVPAHRVVNRNGMLTGKRHFAPPEKMQQLLEKEGVKVVDDKVVDFDKLLWDPVKELEM
jgi:methylated-DNA-protein-cysteine methyltransferase-like protein